MNEALDTSTRNRRLLGLALAVTALSAAAPPVAATAAPAKPTAIVSLGDSYISGEGGRWKGNSTDFGGNRNGTDRAHLGGTSYDPTRIYGASYANGCNRSDVAEIISNGIHVDRKINVSCSGAKVENIVRTTSGGRPLKGEAPQVDQLAAIARDNRVTMIVLSAGGNDWSFGEVAAACITRYLTSSSLFPSTCHEGSQRVLSATLPRAMDLVGRSIDEIRAAMSAQGYSNNDYRIVLQSAPSVMPRGSEIRYPETGTSRASIGGCPLWNSDANWYRDQVIPQLAGALRAVANTYHIDFLDLQNALQGREACSIHARLVDQNNPPSPTTSEWARSLGFGLSQGQFQESLHANYYGQQAIGTCLQVLYTNPRGHYTCTNQPGMDTSHMTLTRM